MPVITTVTCAELLAAAAALGVELRDVEGTGEADVGTGEADEGVGEADEGVGEAVDGVGVGVDGVGVGDSVVVLEVVLVGGTLAEAVAVEVVLGVTVPGWMTRRKKYWL